MEPKFIHLRVHTAYSLSEGAMKVPALVKKLTENHVPAFAMTDTANMFGGKAIGLTGKDGHFIKAKKLLLEDCYNPLGRLCDHTYFETLSEQQKEFYILNLSDKYNKVKNELMCG